LGGGGSQFLYVRTTEKTCAVLDLKKKESDLIW